MTANESAPTAPVGEVFVSYSWDDEKHIQSVLQLSNRLRSEGIDCVLDQYEESPPEGWPRWMDRKIRDSRLVLMVCTETYYKRVMGDERDADTGRGVKWEGGLIYQHLYNAGANQKFIPVLLRDSDRKFIPTPLQSATHYTVNTSAGYDKLYARLLNRPGITKPDLGPVRPLPKKEVKTDLSMYLTGPINVDLWNRAKWRGTLIARCEGLPPILGLGFLDEEAARQIFEGWHKRYGDRDTFEELRVSIIEGEISGELPGYTVHISADLENTIKRYKSAGLEVDVENSMFMMVSRLNRMNPAPGSKNLEMFKELFRHYKTYSLAPAVMKPDGSAVKPMLDLAIVKNTIYFRQASEIDPEHDPDGIAVQMGSVERPLTQHGRALKRKKRRR
jgi:SEFIR domain